MKQLISLLIQKVKTQIVKNNTNIVRLESFNNPLIYRDICVNVHSDDSVDLFIPKMSKEKYNEFMCENRDDWKSALLYFHIGDNIEYSTELTDQYMSKSYVDYNNAMTKWRNESAAFSDGETVLVLLMGTEAAPDTGGLADTSFAITPKKVIFDLKNDYSRWFRNVMANNGIDGDDARKAINTLYKAIFSKVNIDLVKFSGFVDTLEELSFNSIQDLIAHICETLNSTWEIPSIIDMKMVPKSQNLAKGALKNAQIILDAINFIERIDDIPSQSNIAKLKNKFEKYADENGINYSEPFPASTSSSVFVNYPDFENCVIDFMSGKELEKNRARLLKIDFAYISKILGTKLPKTSSMKPKVISGDPLGAYCKMIFHAMATFKNEHNGLPTNIFFRVDHISLSDCTKGHIEDSYRRICNYMGGMLQFINDADIECNGQDIYIVYEQNCDPFNYTNYVNIKNLIKCSGKWGDPCKILYTLNLRNGENEEKYEYKWAFSPNSPWLNAFSYLESVLFRGGDSYTLPTMAICMNMQDYLNCESEDEFYAQLSQIREEVLFDSHRKELRKYFNKTDSLARFDSVCIEFKNFAISLTQNGLFNALDDLRKVVQLFSDMLVNIYDCFHGFSDVQREKLPLLVNSFVITSNNDVLNNCEMKEVLVPAYNPILLEKIDAKLLFIRAGFREIIAGNREMYPAIFDYTSDGYYK